VGDQVNITPPDLPPGAAEWVVAVESHGGNISGGVAVTPGVVVLHYSPSNRGMSTGSGQDFTVVVNIT
jgi:hypothetical protein